MKLMRLTTIMIGLAFVTLSFADVLKSEVTEKADKEIKDETGIEFINDWDLALELAKKEKKLIYLDAMASWCGPCKIMAKKTFKDPAVAEFFNENFINVKMDMEKNDAGSRLMKEFEIVAYPSSIFVDHKEKIVRKELGYLQADRFLQIGKEVAAL